MAIRNVGRIAIVEIGTNSTKFLVASPKQDGGFKTDFFTKRTTRIGRDLKRSGRIAKSGVDETIAAITQFRARSIEYACEYQFAFATYALRKADNSTAVVRRIERTLGHPLRILTGKEEARFAYLSARQSLRLSKPNTVLFDIGGGSTEIIIAKRGRVTSARSLPLGALHLTERFLPSNPIEPGDLMRLSTYLDGRAQKTLAAMTAETLEPSRLEAVASGGSISTAARMIAYDRGVTPSIASSVRIGAGDLSALLDRCAALPLAERRKIAGLEPERADIIVAGLSIIIAFLRCARKRVLLTNPGGVREGVLAHLIERGYRW